MAICELMILTTVFSQDQLTPDQLIDLPFKTLDKLNARLNFLVGKIELRTEKLLKNYERDEQRLIKRIQAKDSTFNNLPVELQVRYDELVKGLKNGAGSSNRVGEYLSNFDSLQTYLGFLSQNSELLTKLSGGSEKICTALKSVNAITEKLKYISSIQQRLKNSRDFLKDQLSGYSLVKELKKMNKDLYYYSQKIKEYKSILNDPKQLELAAFRALNNVPAFNGFFAKNSFIGALFGNSNFSFISNKNAPSIPDIPGLQSRAQVQQLVNNNINISGSGGSSDILQQKLSSVKDALDKLKLKNSSWNDNDEMPQFKPNEMKSRSFLKRLEFGTNVQFAKTNSALPSSAELGVQVAYKFHQNGSVGIGTSYKAGYGNIRRISISHQGISVRSFIDHKLKLRFYINGGFEYNYNAAFKTVAALKDFHAWQKSALIGISKKYSLTKKIKASTMLLYDFLHSQHTPVSPSFIFRIGYHL